jgi:hypothetical protein
VLRQQRQVKCGGLVRIRACRKRPEHFAVAVFKRKRRSVNRHHVQPLRRQQRPGQRKLIVDLVGCIGVDDDARARVWVWVWVWVWVFVRVWFLESADVPVSRSLRSGFCHRRNAKAPPGNAPPCWPASVVRLRKTEASPLIDLGV